MPSIEGVVVFERSEGPDASRCVCCEGAHIYGRDIKLDDEGKPRPYPGLYLETVDDFINDALLDPELEGKRVRISIEVVG